MIILPSNWGGEIMAATQNQIIARIAHPFCRGERQIRLNFTCLSMNSRRMTRIENKATLASRRAVGGLALLIAICITASSLHGQTTATWIGGNGNYNTAANWDLDGVLVPINNGGNLYNVVIPASKTVAFDVPGNTSISSFNLASGSTFSIDAAGRNLIIIGAAGVGGQVTATGGSFAVGPGGSIGANATLNASNGGIIDLSNSATISYFASFFQGAPTIFQSNGTNGSGVSSLLDLKSLTSIQTTDGNPGGFYQYITASSGGVIDLRNLTTASNVDGGAGRLKFQVLGGNPNGAGQIRLDSLTSVTQVGFNIQAGTQSLPSLATADMSDFTVASGATISAPNLHTLTSGVVSVTGSGLLSTGSLSSINYSKFDAEGGGQISNITAGSYYASFFQGAPTIFQSNGTNGSGVSSLLDLKSLTSIQTTDGNPGGFYQYITASSGGVIDLRNLTTASNVDGGAGRLKFQVLGGNPNGAGQIRLDSLTSVTQVGFNIQAGTQSLPSLATADMSDFTVASGATISAPNLHTLTSGVVSVTGSGLLSTGSLSSINYSKFDAEGGGQISNITAGSYYASFFQGAPTIFQSNGTNGSGVSSLLDLKSLTSIQTTDGNPGGFYQYITASSGGVIDLRNLTTASNVDGGAGRLKFQVLGGNPNGAGQIRLDSLTSVTQVGFNIQAGTQSLPSLATADMSDFTVASGATISAPNLHTLTSGVVSVTGSGLLSTGSLSSINYSKFDAEGGGQISNITAGSYYASFFQGAPTIFQSNGTNGSGVSSLLDLKSLTSIQTTDGNPGGFYQYITASSGGVIDLRNLTTASNVDGGAGRLKFQVLGGNPNGAGQIRLDSLTSVTQVGFNIQAGTQSLPSLATAINADFAVSGGASLAAPQLAATGSVNLSVSGNSSLLRVKSSNNSVNSSINASSGGELQLGGDFNLQQTTESLVQLQTGKLHFDGTSLQKIEIGGQDVSISGNPSTNSGNFGIGQLIVGTATQKSTLLLTDLIDNGNRNGSGGAAEALYLYGIGGQSGLQLLNNSTLALNGLNVYAWDAASNSQILLNSLFPTGINRVAYSGGTIQRFANLGPYVWSATGNGNWDTGTNWTPNFVPDGDEKVIFGSGITGPTTVTVNNNFSVSEFEFNNSTNSYTIAGDGTHGLQLTGSVTIDVLTGSHTISAPLTSTSGLTKSGPGTIRLSGSGSISGPTNIQAGTLGVGPAMNLSGSSTITVDAGATFDVTDSPVFQLHGGQTLTGRGVVRSSLLTLLPNSELRGALQIQGSVANAGLVAPGFSPEIMVIAGNYSQQPAGVLEMEVGGTIPGAQHDMLIATGTASLAGRLNVPIINGYVPHVNDEIQLLLASSVTGTFDSTFFPNLPASVAHELDYSATGVRLKFVAPTPIQFVSAAPIATWSSNASWEANGLSTTPESKNVISVENLAGVAQRVDVTAANQSVHQLLVGDATTGIAVRVDGVSLSVAASTMIEDNGSIELANSGKLVSQSIDVRDGGMLAGNGMIKTNTLVISGGTLRPGFSVGHLDVDGAYQQNANGTLLVDIQGAGQYDTVTVTGAATLHGKLQIDVSSLGSFTRGQPIPILTAGSLTGQFDTVEWTGNDNIYFKVIYGSAGSGSVASGASLDGAGVSLEAFDRGNMNGDNVIDDADFDLFAFGLMNHSVSKFLAKCGCDITPQEGGDFNGNGVLDFDDIAGFQNRMVGMGLSIAGLNAAIDHYLSAVPEPSSTMLAIFAGLCFCQFRFRHATNWV